MTQSVLHRYIIPALFILLWSSAFISSKYSVDHAPPLAILAVRMSIVVVLLGGWLWWRHGTGLFRSATAIHWCSQAVVGLLIHCCYLGGVFIAIEKGMDVGIAALIVGLQPILTAWLAAWLFKEQLTLFSVTGLLLGMVGLYVVIESRFGLAGVSEMSSASIIAIVMSLVAISIATLLQKRVGQTGLMLFNTWLQYLFAATGFLIVSLSTEQWVFNWNAELVLSLSWMVLAISLGAIPLLMLMIRAGEATRVSSIFYLVTPVTALLAYLFFGEQLSLNAWLGMALVVIGVALVVTPKQYFYRLSIKRAG
ncbi:DMT family transporter [Amphritea balenae]|uniref:DMT family transporter n=1 Tax=Amphritea balenae TaxID=452629 RepID=A0A3P1SJB8_9GAMM|nr:DMT family transporter [Amphritea balenae]RRC97060.1 DMT family transporter [Amphritea balenae]GGK67637.1 peptide ABC transporter ATP-binding protein [Amphritea balenae]